MCAAFLYYHHCIIFRVVGFFLLGFRFFYWWFFGLLIGWFNLFGVGGGLLFFGCFFEEFILIYNFVFPDDTWAKRSGSVL